jgi:hypothetical protein
MEGLEERVATLLGARPTDWQWRSAAWQPAVAVEGGNERLPAPATAPTVRDMQRRQLEVALAWAEHELGLA